MDTTYNPSEIEARWRQTWENSDAYAAGQHVPGEGAPYCIQIPPPNVTGTLHMGHAFQHTIMDALIRHARMQGKDVLWQMGTDHAGIATQMVVERNLKLNGEPSRAELGREKFIEKVWEWKKYSAGTIAQQIRRLGSSVDWNREDFTMNPAYSEAVIEHFVKLYEDGLIYRGKRLVNWDPVLQTAISDLEVVSEEENGKLWHIRYPLAGGYSFIGPDGYPANYLVVATTRPETLLGDAAVAVHPEDERYAHLVGKFVELPLCNRRIPIIADTYVEKDFGSGCVKITPAHDFNDYAVGQRHKSELAGQPSDGYLNIFSPTACVIAEDPNLEASWTKGLGEASYIPKKYQSLDRFVARKQIVADLEASTAHASAPCQTSEDGKRLYPCGLIEKIEDHKLKVPRGDRSGAVLEPYLTDQWFVDLTRAELADGCPGGYTAITQPAIKAVEDGLIQFVPDNWKNTYYHWLNNIQDWCISRQLWWGHRIPAWYYRENAVGLEQLIVARNASEAKAKLAVMLGKPITDNEWAAMLTPNYLGKAALRQDSDVFDTWFSSDIWPMATLGWPQQTPELAKYYPSSVLVTGFDIIFFWVARMVMMGRYFMADVPFKDVFITGLVRDPEGNKMSKSKGNVLDPLDVVDGIALDALVQKRTTGLMKPETAPKIEAKTRKDYPKGIAPTGTDALRFTFAALATNGRDVRFDAGRAEGYRNFCNKIWNASRYVLMQTEGKDCAAADDAVELSAADKWIISTLQRLEQECAEHFAAYRFDLLAQALYQFVWNEYCDWYLELSKPVLQQGNPAQQAGTRRTLVRVLETTLRLLHPLMPFITEEIWQKVFPLTGKAAHVSPLTAHAAPLLMHQPYPVCVPERIDPVAEADIAWLKAFILGVRQIRSGMDISPAKTLPLLVQHASAEDAERLARMQTFVVAIAKTEPPKVLTADDAAPESATALLGEMKLLVPMAGLIDKTAELARLAKQVEKLQKDIAITEGRIANASFAKAPEAVQQKTRELNAQQVRDLAALQVQIGKIEAL